MGDTDANFHPRIVRQSVLGFSLKGMSAHLGLPGELVEAGLGKPQIVLGAPGSGKTSLIRARVAHAVAGGVNPDAIRILTPTREQATRLRDELGVMLGVPTRGAMVMSVQAFCFSLLRSDQEARGVEPSKLRSGADVDQDIRSVLDEQRDSGVGPQWPEHLHPAVRSTEAFRTELRELIARLTEWGLGSRDLRRWSSVHPAWPAVADFLDDYERVIARSRPDEYDAAELLRVATSLIEASSTPPEGLRMVLCDDFQDLSPAAGSLVQALHSASVHVGIYADPDLAGQTFRGADPEGPMRVADLLSVTPHILPVVYRHGQVLRDAVSSITSRIGTARAGAQRKAQSADLGLEPDGDHPFLAVRSPSAGREAHDIARVLLSRHRDHGVAFSEMAIATRRASHIPFLAHALQQAGIATEQDYRVGLGEHPASKDLVGWVLAARTPGWLTPERATVLLEGLYGGFDSRRLRRLGSFLRVIDQAEGQPRRGIESIIDVLESGEYPPELPASFHRPLSRILEVLAAIRALPEGSSAALVLSTAWQAWAVEDSWVARSSDASQPSLFHREALHQVSALLATAERFVERHHGVSPEAFFRRVLDNDITEDVVVQRSERTGVLISTPAGLAGVECDTVVLQGLNDHVWPNTRIRWSLLGAPLVARAVRGQLDEAIDDQRVVIDDELRMAALALSRARHLALVSAIESEDTGPSALFRLLAERAHEVPSDPGPLGSSRELVGHYRSQLEPSVTEAERQSAASALSLLAAREVQGAHPSQWWGLGPITSDTPLYHDAEIPLSPSRIGAVEQSPLDWFLDRVAPDEYTAAVGIGSLVHYALEHEPWGDEDTLLSLVEGRWSELDFDSGWVSKSEASKARGLVHALAAYLRERQAAGAEVVGIEQGFQLRVDNIVVNGLVDRIERSADGGLVVVDLKTGKAITNAEEIASHPQLQAYQLALADPATREAWEVEGPSEGAWLLYVSGGVRGKPFRVAAQEPLGEEGIQQSLERIRSAGAHMAQARFMGPRFFPVAGRSVSRHRWQRVGSVCGD